MNILMLYHSTQTYTNTVFEHVDAFSRFSRHRYFYCHHDERQAFNVDLRKFDAVVIHYCLRLPYDQVSVRAAQALANFTALKVLFIQDEYDHTRRAWHWIRRLGIQLVFTVVPPEHIERVYPAHEFPGVRFVSNLTGYVPEKLNSYAAFTPPSQRSLVIGYRGRPLPVRYGQLGKEKVGIGQLVKAYCERLGYAHDIAWTEEARIYGDRWYEFMGSCRAMLGSESGSNVFDWDGTLGQRVADYRSANPSATEDEVYAKVVAEHEMPGVMNQISPRSFEAITMRTVMVMFEGSYSGVIRPWEHYIPLKKDGSNLHEVFAKLHDPEFVDAMAERAYRDVIGSGRYSYAAFIGMTDGEIEASASQLATAMAPSVTPVTDAEFPTVLTASPIRWPAPGEQKQGVSGDISDPRLRNLVAAIWAIVPGPVKPVLSPVARYVLRPAWRGLRLVRRTLRPARS